MLFDGPLSNSCNYYVSVFLLLFGTLTLICEVYGVDDEDVYWKPQAEASVKKKYSQMFNKNCSIERIPIENNEPIISPTNETLRNDNSSNTEITTQRNVVTNDSSGNVTPADTLGGLVIDPCRNEENRGFMECVLKYSPGIKESDPDYNTGICMCYRDWSIRSGRIPAYNHNLDVNVESHDWFVYSPMHRECIVKNRKRCAPKGTLTVPYRCEGSLDPNTKKGSNGRCVDLEIDEHYMICKGSWTLPIIAILVISFLTVVFNP